MLIIKLSKDLMCHRERHRERHRELLAITLDIGILIPALLLIRRSLKPISPRPHV